jgi:hypothetical protein
LKSKEKMSQTKEKILMQKNGFFKDRFSLGLGDFLSSLFPPLSKTKRKL